jgi:uncharacterized protein YndB with AHSA1/START domain
MDDAVFDYPAGEPIIVMTRTFDAPRELVWAALTEARHIPQWWGRRGATTKVVTMDVRPGGAWRFEQKMADGSAFVFLGKYLEVVPPEKLVNTFGVEGMFEGKALVETHTLTADGKKTRYRSVSKFDTIADRDGMAATGMEEGARESFGQLDELLRTM